MMRHTDFVYLASPYTAHPAGPETAFREVCHAAAELIRHRVPVFCPIAHSHPVAMHGPIDPTSHDVWLPVDRPFMAHAACCVVLMLDGWDESFGVSEEVRVFRAAEKPVIYWRPGDPVPLPLLVREGVRHD